MTGFSSATSSSLLREVRDRDDRAWERLVRLYAPFVHRWCQHYRLQEQDAADVFQEVFRAVARRVSDFRRAEPGGTFRGWLTVITRNKIRDHLRRRRAGPLAEGGTAANERLANVELVPEPDDADDSLVTAAKNELFQRALASVRGEFEEKTWQAFWRTTVDDQPGPEAAAALGMTAGAVRVAKSRVLRRLRQVLGD